MKVTPILTKFINISLYKDLDILTTKAYDFNIQACYMQMYKTCVISKHMCSLPKKRLRIAVNKSSRVLY